MISRKDTLKTIKEKVDSRSNGKFKLKKPFECKFEEGVFRHTEVRKIVSLHKNGNSILWQDNNYQLRNINMLDTKDLHKLMWMLISDKEKKEIALEHLLSTRDYLIN